MPTPEKSVDFVFFDIGETLGHRDPQTGLFRAFPDSIAILTGLRDAVGVRIGVITNLGTQISEKSVRTMLAGEGLATFLDPAGFISDQGADAEKPAGVGKPDVRIYQFAARQVNVPVGRCLYVGEDIVEVIGAQVAGMKAVLKPPPH